ncbi:hypothetical protein FF125_16185 [Aureibaculum algae]|uniref:Uncharacterized protein n=1 Tax=Aureibaculum algae TaxID=2584122 RepID=A0A5B7TXD0_9FLAO|nr:hypothetical protein [Aureibaculum algae]QCX39901.1 hypothetical protein FF125_16185 [Aureibaculum algae]
MKKTLKLFVVFFAIVLLSNCEKEPIQNNIKTENNLGILIESVSIEELQQNEKLASTIDGIASAFDINKRITKKSKGGINSNDNSFTILTDKILKVKTDSSEVYTFKIKKPTLASSSFENFVIQKKYDNNYNFYIYRFTFDVGGKNNDFPYKIRRKRVSSDQINIGKFHNFLKQNDLPDGCYDAYCIKSPRTFECDWILEPTDCPSNGSGNDNNNSGDNDGNNDNNGGSWGDINPDGISNNGGVTDGDDDDDAITPIIEEFCQEGYILDGSGNCVTEAYFDEQIFIDDEFKDNPCLKGVYDDMGKASKFKEYLNNFDENFTNPVANLRFSVGVHPIYPNATAVTDEPDNYLIKITFNPNTLNRPKLDIARTMIHEVIHAEMYRKLLSIAKQPNIPWTEEFIHSLKNDYKGLTDYYTRYWLEWPLDQQPGDPQHQLMAEHFIDIIVQALKDVDSSLTDLQYKAIAWAGLKGTSEPNALNQLDPATGLPQNPTVAWSNVPLAERLLLNSTYETFKSSNTNCQ